MIVVLEAMKMEQPLKAHKAGTVTALQAEVGATVTNGAVICELKDRPAAPPGPAQQQRRTCPMRHAGASPWSHGPAPRDTNV